MEITRLLALISDSCPWLTPESVSPDNTEWGMKADGRPIPPIDVMTVELDPHTFMVFMGGSSQTQATLIHDSGCTEVLLDPETLDNYQWSDFVGWVANAVGAYKDHITAHPLQCYVPLDPIEYGDDTVPSTISPLEPVNVHPVLRKISPDGTTWVHEPCLHAYMRNGNIIPLPADTTQHPAIRTIQNDSMPFEDEDMTTF
jgi:hypothetical protein